MRFIAFERITPGMVLGRAVRDYKNRLLLNEGVVLTPELITRLEGLGYPGFYVHDELSKDIEINEAISQELRNRATAAVRDLNVDVISDVAKNIVEQILNSPTVSLDMADLRTFDDYTFAHSVNVAVVSTVMGMGCHMSHQDLIYLCQAALFHDIGKLSIDPEILNRPGPLSREEMTLVRRHPQNSYDMLSENWEIPSSVRLGVLMHHENEDGSGYPNGLKGDKIHPFAKIIHIADVYDALSSKRPYKKAYSCAETLEYIMSCCYYMFDEEYVRTFLRCVPIYPKGTMVYLSDGREALVVENTALYATRPKLRLEDGTDLDMLNDASLRNVTIVAENGNELLDTGEIEQMETERKVKEIIEDVLLSPEE